MPWPPHEQTAQDLIDLIELSQYFKNFPKDFIPPKFVDPDYVPPSREMWMVTFATATFVLTAAIFTARIVVRVMSKSMGKDDWAIIAAFTSYCAFTATQWLVGVSGIGYHSYDLAIIDITNTFKIIYAHSLLWATTLHLCRISILFLFMRVTEAANSKWVRRYVNFMVWLSFLYLIFNVLFLAFECRPLSKSFDLKARLSGSCIGFPRETLYFALAAGHIFIDLCVIIPPIPVIRKLSMSRQRKINLYILLSFGVVCCFCASMKMFYAYGKMINGYDLTWDAIPVAFWGQAEATLGIIIACLPALNRVFIRIIPCFHNKKKQDTMQFVIRDEESPRHRPAHAPFDVSEVSTNQSWFIDSRTGSQAAIVDAKHIENAPFGNVYRSNRDNKRDTTEIKVSKSVSVISSTDGRRSYSCHQKAEDVEDSYNNKHPQCPLAIYSGPNPGMFTSYAGRASSIFSFSRPSVAVSSNNTSCRNSSGPTEKPCLLQQALGKRYGSWGNNNNYNNNHNNSNCKRKIKSAVDRSSIQDYAESYYDAEAERARYHRSHLASRSQESVIDPHRGIAL